MSSNKEYNFLYGMEFAALHGVTDATCPGTSHHGTAKFVEGKVSRLTRALRDGFGRDLSSKYPGNDHPPAGTYPGIYQ